MYLQAVTISDISMPNGVSLDNGKLHGMGTLFSSQPKCITIHQERPSLVEWSLWRRANKLWSDENGRLHCPLGHWILSTSQQRQVQFAYYRGRKLFTRSTDGHFLVHRQIRRGCFRHSEEKISIIHLPERAVPVEVDFDDNHTWIIRGQGKRVLIKSSSLPVTATFDSFIDSLPPWEVELLRHTHLYGDPFTVQLELRSGFRAVSDGSVRQIQGAFGWSLATEKGERAVFGKGPVCNRSPTSYRAEACGLLSILRFLIRLAEFTSMPGNWRGIIATDSQASSAHWKEEIRIPKW